MYFWCSVHYLSAKSYIAYTILQYMCHDCRPYPSDVTIIFILYCTSALLAKYVSTYLLSYIVVDCILLASFLHSVCISFSLKTYSYIQRNGLHSLWKMILSVQKCKYQLICFLKYLVQLSRAIRDRPAIANLALERCFVCIECWRAPS